MLRTTTVRRTIAILLMLTMLLSLAGCIKRMGDTAAVKQDPINAEVTELIKSNKAVISYEINDSSKPIKIMLDYDKSMKPYDVMKNAYEAGRVFKTKYGDKPVNIQVKHGGVVIGGFSL